jgi:CDGSH iron-sulfur domain-containing protein 3
MSSAKIHACEPALVKLEAGKIYSWCTCGHSEKQPFCDGKHKTVECGGLRSHKFQVEEEQEVWLCQCKHTSTPPFCDGTHHTLK